MPTSANRSWRYVSRKNPRGSRKTRGSSTSTPGNGWSTMRMSEGSGRGPVLDQLHQVLPVRILAHRRGDPLHVLGGDVAEPPGDFFDAGHHLALALFDALHER